MKLIDLTGMRFGKLKVVSYHGKINGSSRWNCICDCGEERLSFSQALRLGKVFSCGCEIRKLLKSGNLNRSHGKSSTSTYSVWLGMRDRCVNPRNRAYERYGARGISICDRWMTSFENFFADMGERPANKSIERVDNDLGYSPENCVWATALEQRHNRREVSTYERFEVDGFRGTIPELAKHFGFLEAALRYRIRVLKEPALTAIRHLQEKSIQNKK